MVWARTPLKEGSSRQKGENGFSRFYEPPWGRGILISMTCFRGRGKQRGDRRAEKDQREIMLLKPSYFLYFKVLSMPKCYTLVYDFLIPNTSIYYHLLCYHHYLPSRITVLRGQNYVNTNLFSKVRGLSTIAVPSIVTVTCTIRYLCIAVWKTYECGEEYQV